MAETRGSTPESLEVQLVPPNTKAKNVTLLSRKLLHVVQEDMQRLADEFDDPSMAKDVIVRALEVTAQLLRDEDAEPKSTEMEDDHAESIRAAAYWTPEQKKMGALTAKLKRQMEVMDQRMDIIEIELHDLCEHIEWVEEGRQEGSDGE